MGLCWPHPATRRWPDCFLTETSASHYGPVHRLKVLLAAAGALVLALTTAPLGAAAPVTPWFVNQVGNATQVISVVGTGGSDAKMDVYQRTAAGWEPVATGIPAKIGANGMLPQTHDGNMATPMGVFTLPFAFGTAANPGGGLQYVQVTPEHWWDGDMKSPTYNTMQVCKKADCPFNTDPASGTENLDIPQYKHAVVMGVNTARVPGNGGAFFLHTTDGGATAGCVAIDDATLVKIMQWLQPGALIAVAK
ncbi:MAG: L,D-transpeptidase family protein [Mycobacterium sp.]|nr:L,D-transpeptidase family protein [Mycobacterium sp.]